MKYELLPCPFCGALANVEKNGDTYSVKAFHSNKCYLYKVKPPKAFIREAIVKQWNRRGSTKISEGYIV